MNDARLARAADEIELRGIAMRYARAIDRRDRELLLSCYHPDATDEHGTLFSGDARAYADWQPEVMRPFEVTAHYIMNTSYRVAGERAQGEIYFVAFHRTLPPAPREIVVGGRYLDDYERRAGEWRIARRMLVWDFSREQPVDAQQLEFLRSLGAQGAGAGDPSRERLDLFRR